MKEKALVARPTLPKRGLSPTETFHWHVKPRELPVYGAKYSDGPVREGAILELARCGWAFVIADEVGTVLAAAYGVPPPWIDDSGGAEAWAMLQASLHSMLGPAPYWSDCLPLVQAMHKGSSVATDPKDPLARVYALLHVAIEDTNPDCFGWTPAHLGGYDVGRARKGDGAVVTAVDKQANDLADGLAKEEVELHRLGWPPPGLLGWPPSGEPSKQSRRKSHPSKPAGRAIQANNLHLNQVHVHGQSYEVCELCIMFPKTKTCINL